MAEKKAPPTMTFQVREAITVTVEAPPETPQDPKELTNVDHTAKNSDRS